MNRPSNSSHIIFNLNDSIAFISLIYFFIHANLRDLLNFVEINLISKCLYTRNDKTPKH